ncbi:TetR family transcriptional regulator [Antrihabitans sp. YC3-6]|uniref:TetR family transcriptional regulator n=1 Tax=Antrihabitans stalagmiti TaxID=2799499 RepID=A0A934U4B3_9NOCA|nr:TetR family transcriptional regulator [Antrihabitans stalagmiti]MBJ8340276.1 TetR family transcriptional regulator [Antrihabitans stalagmiti]
MEQTSRDPYRRSRIAECAINIVGTDGMRALTHRAVDDRLGLPAGSTSYYYRTRRSLLEAMVGHLTEKSRQDFRSTRRAALPDLDRTSVVIGRSLDHLLARRRADIAARYALAIEVADDPDLRAALASCFFSRDHATELFRQLHAADPYAAAADLVSLCEGLVFDRFAGARSLDKFVAGTSASVAQLTAAVSTFLRGVGTAPKS